MIRISLLRLHVLHLLPALLVVATPVLGQSRSRTAPDQVVREAFRALSERRWNDAATLVHPEPAGELFNERVKLARLAANQPQVDTASAHHAGIPACVAEFFNSMGRIASGSGLSRDFANVESVDELEQLGPRDALARWIEAHDRGERWRAFRLPASPGVATPAATPQVERAVLGMVTEHDSLAHVTYREIHRLSTGAVVEQAVRAVSLRRTVHGWMLLLDETLFGYRPLPVSIPDTAVQP